MTREPPECADLGGAGGAHQCWVTLGEPSLDHSGPQLPPWGAGVQAVTGRLGGHSLRSEAGAEPLMQLQGCAPCGQRVRSEME